MMFQATVERRVYNEGLIKIAFKIQVSKPNIGRSPLQPVIINELHVLPLLTLPDLPS